MKKNSVHVITKYFYPVTAGIETNILETYSKLVDKWNITIHTTANEYLRSNSLPKFERIRGLKVVRYPFNSEVKGYMAKIDFKNTHVIAIHNFNVFFWRYFVMVLYHKIVGKKNYTFVLTPHGGFCPEWSMFSFGPRVIKYLYHRFIGSIMINKLVDVVRTVSSWEREEMIKLGINPKIISTITNGLEEEAFMDVDSLASTSIKKKVAKIGDYIIQIGRIYPIKNYETVIKALPTIANIKYVIVGQIEKSIKHANYQKDLIALARELKVEDRVIFLGVVRGIDKYYLLKHAKMMVHMALWESYCNVVHEGMSQGLVCIVANNTALPLLVKDGVNGYVVSTRDSVELADKINFVLDEKNSMIISKIQKLNISSGKNDSWDNVSTRMHALYEGIK